MHLFSIGDRLYSLVTLCCCCTALSIHLVLLRKYVSQQAWDKGRALLEALGLTGAQIAKSYSLHFLNEEESVQHGLQVWVEGGINTTWDNLIKAMEAAGIAVQQRNGLKEELCSNKGDSMCFDFSHMLACACVLCVCVCVCVCVRVCVCV